MSAVSTAPSRRCCKCNRTAKCVRCVCIRSRKPCVSCLPGDLGRSQNSSPPWPPSGAHSRPAPRAWPAPSSSSACPTSSLTLLLSPRHLLQSAPAWVLLPLSPWPPQIICHPLHPVSLHTPVLNPLNLSRPFFLPNLQLQHLFIQTAHSHYSMLSSIHGFLPFNMF